MSYTCQNKQPDILEQDGRARLHAALPVRGLLGAAALGRVRRSADQRPPPHAKVPHRRPHCTR